MRQAYRLKLRSKYRNIPTSIDGHHFDSQAEARRYAELLILQNAGHISNLKLQTSWKLDVLGVHICNYRCDFQYHEGDSLVIEDVKSKITKTRVYLLKKKLMLALYQINIREIE